MVVGTPEIFPLTTTPGFGQLGEGYVEAELLTDICP
jgi:hypothetical protein